MSTISSYQNKSKRKEVEEKELKLQREMEAKEIQQKRELEETEIRLI